MAALEKADERWFEPEVNRIAGEIALMGPQNDNAKGEAYFERALVVARQQQAKIVGTPRLYEPCPPLARPGQDRGSARAVGTGLWAVH